MTEVLENTQTAANIKWVDICQVSDLVEYSGVCAILPAYLPASVSSTSLPLQSPINSQIALFYLPKEQAVYTVSNWDPIGKANVIYRGIVGSIKNELMVASPLYKQHFSLISGVCFEEPAVALNVYPSRIDQDKVQIAVNQVTATQ